MNNNTAQGKRWAIYKCGHVEENGNIIDPKLITTIIRHPELDLYEIAGENIYDYFAVQEEKHFSDWVSVEGTEMYLSPCKTVTCGINVYQDFTYNRDLNPNIHKGFTIGKGKTLYFSMIWHKSGHVTVYPINGNRGRYIDGGSEITIHWKH